MTSHELPLEKRLPPLLAKVEALFRENRRYGRFTLVTAFILATTLILPRSEVQEYRYEVGRQWQEPDLRASFAFPILKNEQEYQLEKQGSLKVTPDVFSSTPDLLLHRREALATYYEQLAGLQAQWLRLHQHPDSEGQEKLVKQLKALNPPLEADYAGTLFAAAPDYKLLQQKSLAAFDRVYRVAYLDRDLGTLNTGFVALRRTPTQEVLTEKSNLYDAIKTEKLVAAYAEEIKETAARLFKEVLQTYLKPNYNYNAALTEQSREAAAQTVSHYYGKVEEGQLIVAHAQTVTPDIGNILRSLNAQKESRGGNTTALVTFLGQLVMVGLLALLTLNFLRVNRKEIYTRNRKVALIFFIYFLMTALNVLVMYVSSHFTSTYAVNFYYLVPMSMAPIMLTIFFDDRVGFFGNIIIALLAGFIIHNNFEFFFIQICAGSTAVSGLRILRKRSQFFTTALTLLLTYWITYLGYSFYLKGNLAEVWRQNIANLFLFGVNVLFTLATYPMIYLFEKLFNITSDLTYIELLDSDHPLLKELSFKAPGTYQHSMQVANIAEAVANKIGANALQVRVGALFHDIGKIYQPEYFIENQRSGANPHERLSPPMSAEIIINHVAYGEELARQHNLPTEVIEFIRTHHGTSRVEYFYRLQRIQHTLDAEDDHLFRYRGPLPSTKEMAILMIADSAEAASHAMKNPTPEELKDMIETIVSQKINDNQLVLARITFRDVYTIKSEVLKILNSIYHSRIEYPTRVAAAAPAVL